MFGVDVEVSHHAFHSWLRQLGGQKCHLLKRSLEEELPQRCRVRAGQDEFEVLPSVGKSTQSVVGTQEDKSPMQEALRIISIVVRIIILLATSQLYYWYGS